MASALDDVLDQAAAAAANFQAPVVQARGTYLFSAPGGAGIALAAPGADTFLDGGGMEVDAYFRIKAEGFRIGDDMKGLWDTLDVVIDLDEVAYMYSASGNNGQGTATKFIKSYDGQSTPQGGNFQQAVLALKASSSHFRDVYQSAEIPVTLLADAKDPKSSLTFEAGTRVGLTPSVTGFKPWQRFAKKQRASGIADSEVKVRLTCEKKVNARKEEWGVIKFERLES